MWRTTRFNSLIDRIGRRLSPFWRVFWTLGSAISVGAMVYITYILGRNLFYIFFQTESASPVSPLIPGITLSLNFNTLFFFGVSLAIIIVFHEFSHGVAARAENVGIKSTGLLLLAVIPGAFVEPDEEDLKKAKRSTQARVFSAGSTCNILMGILALFLLTNSGIVLAPLYHTEPSGIQITEIVPGSPADGILRNWDIIKSINGFPVNDSVSLSSVLSMIPPNSTVPFVLSREGSEIMINFTLGQSPTRNSSYIGINSFSYYEPRAPFIPPMGSFYILGLLSWFYLLSINIGLINMMPVVALDGDKLATIIINSIFRNEKRASQATNILRWSCLLILLLNISMSFVLFPSFKFG
ncbi:MAG: site-2 protease family protein [Candidatus Verstraetearchaeota archaeon]|nr:site-2 protease family protein [Candidatus Verstraetearchaeota archaeon]